jgi:hypothetical protein
MSTQLTQREKLPTHHVENRVPDTSNTNKRNSIVSIRTNIPQHHAKVDRTKPRFSTLADRAVSACAPIALPRRFWPLASVAPFKNRAGAVVVIAFSTNACV